ncbi:MAG: peptidase, partial [Frankiales bacterium]|nr:peptidase [Frankiales bacterium]
AEAELVASTLAGLGVRVLETDLASRRIRISATAEVMNRVFGTDLQQASSERFDGAVVEHRHRTGELSVPAPLAGVVVAVLGLDDRPQARAHFRVASAASGVSYTPVQLGEIYGFPAAADGRGQTIAIIELGGGFAQADLDAYFGSLGISGVQVRSVGVDGASNVAGGDPSGADGEVLLDVEVIGALAPAADVAVYFAPNTDAGFLDAVATAAHASPTPTSMSISWGQSEGQWTAQARAALDEALLDAVALGVTVTAAAGDGGSADGETDSAAHVDFPAASPHALACGGTSLRADPTTLAVTAESVWNDGASGGATGGGISTAFDRPSWQASVGVSAPGGAGGRGVPDVAGNADPRTGYQVRIDGQDTVIGGTSAVAPLWAALLARIAQLAGHRLGLVQPTLYGQTAAGRVAPGFRDITTGDNGAFAAGPGWDACTGLGVPLGAAVLSLFTGEEPQ